MNIVGITTCIGPLYAGLLAKTLKVWMRNLDELLIMTDGDTYMNMLEHEERTGDARTYIVATDAFTKNGAKFNKAAALNEAIERSLLATDWIVAFDCDMLPPSDWREVAAKNARRACINGAQRYTPYGIPEDRRWFPRGYFQLWHVSSPHHKPFDESSGNAGGYDTEFAERWSQEYWNDLRFRLTHLGQKQKHWYGPGTTNSQMQEAVAAASTRRKERRR